MHLSQIRHFLSEDYFELKATETLGFKKLPYYPEELKLGLFPQERVSTSDKCHQSGPHLCVRANICPASALLIILGGTPYSWKAPSPDLNSAQDGT